MPSALRKDFAKQREETVRRLIREGFLKSQRMIEAMRKVPREIFIPEEYLKYIYIERPFPIPGDGKQRISCPHSYPLFYEELELKEGDNFLEIGAGSGYGAALAREVVGRSGKVATIEINEKNL